MSYHITILTQKQQQLLGAMKQGPPLSSPSPSCTAHVTQRLPKWFATTLRFSSGKASLTSDSTTGCAPAARPPRGLQSTRKQ